MDHVRLGTGHVGGSGDVYYPLETARWRMAALTITLTLGVAGSFAIGQALGHHAPTSSAHHSTVTRSAGSATGALSTASAPTPTPQTQSKPMSATSHGDKHAGNGHSDDHHHEGGDHHGGGSDGGGGN